MTSYLRAWWFGEATTTTTTTDNGSNNASNAPLFSPSTPSLEPSTSPDAPLEVPSAMSVTISTPEETQEAIDEAQDEADNKAVEDDIPPTFPSLNSIQRSTSIPQQAKLPAKSDAELMPPPALPVKATSPSGATGSSSQVSPQPIGASTSSLLPPAPLNSLLIPSIPRNSSNTLKLPPSTTRAPLAPSKRREKVALAPGHSPLDWAALKASGQNLRGTPGLMRITPSQLKAHNKRDDAWSAFNGKVYNITPYLPFHPGGEKELMRVAGRDGTKLFALTHAWVNVEFMLDECMVGFFVPEPSSAA